MEKLRLLDLFSGAGGAAAGYVRAGFDVVGVDIEPHESFPWEFVLGDALEVLADVSFVRSFDAVHLSPPCQRYSTGTKNASRHPDLIAPCRELVQATGVPYIMENVPQAPLLDPVQVCGSALGLRVRRHRRFESSFQLEGTACHHKAAGTPVGVYGDHPDPRPYSRPGGGSRGAKATSLEDGQHAMGGLWWMDWGDLAEAIPAQYTEHLGRQLREHLENFQKTGLA